MARGIDTGSAEMSFGAGYAERQSEQGLYAHRPGGGRGRMRGRCAADGYAIPARLNIRV